MGKMNRMQKIQERIIRKKVRKHMFELMRKTNEFTATTLVEQTARDLNYDEWLDDDTHFVWDIAVDVVEKKAKNY